MTNKKKTDITLLSTQRRFIMGIAILWVAWFHTYLLVGIPGLSFLRETGYGGVDLFFLMSGIGVYYSLKNNKDTVSYIKNRAKRILPSYFPFITVWLIMMKMTSEICGTEIIGNLTMMGWWCESRYQFNWYINAIWLFYLLAPIFVGMVCKAEDRKRRIRITVLLMVVGFFVSMTFWKSFLLMAFSRLPVFILGIYLGSEILAKNKHSLIIWNILMVAGVGILYICLTKLNSYMWSYGLWWYPFVLIVPGLAMNLGIMAELLSKCRAGKMLSNAINTVGEASFEIYLWHIAAFEFVKPRFEMNAIKWTCLFAAVVVWGVCYRRIVGKICKCL